MNLLRQYNDFTSDDNNVSSIVFALGAGRSAIFNFTKLDVEKHPFIYCRKILEGGSGYCFYYLLFRFFKFRINKVIIPCLVLANILYILRLSKRRRVQDRSGPLFFE